MNSPLVSILIDNYNYGQFIGASIESALNQTYQNFEIIVVDDGSTDNSREVIQQYGNQVQAIFKENEGQPSALNAGFTMCKGDIICFLDSDDIYKPNKIQKIVEAYQQYPEIGWCFHAYWDVDASGQTVISRYPRTEIGSQRIDFRMAMKAGKKPTFAPATSSLSFSRTLLEKILPMPSSRKVKLNENYIKYCAILLEEGFFIDEELTELRIHGVNQASLRSDKPLFKAVREMMIAYLIKTNFPDSMLFTNRLFGISSGTYRRHMKTSQETQDYEELFQELMEKYYQDLSPVESFRVRLRSLYHHRLRDLNLLR